MASIGDADAGGDGGRPSGTGAAERQAVKPEAAGVAAGPGAEGGLAANGEVTKAAEAEAGFATTGFFKYQRQADALYQHVKVQILVAILIVANFGANIIEKQIDPKESFYATEFKGVGTFFNIAFAVELLLNMYSSWLCNFWCNGWNCFDFLVVAIGILTEVNAPLPGPLSKLRMMRAFRVFRLFKRAPSLNRIITSLANALPGVFNAFIIMIIVMSIYAMVAVEIFGEQGKDCLAACMAGPLELCDFPVTSRMMCIGPDLFGTFLRSFYSLFQVLTNESWSEAVTRPLFAGLYRGGPSGPLVSMGDVGAAIFFTSFVIINSVVLINVVVAVLLDQMCGEPATEGPNAGPADSHGDEKLRSAGLGSEEPWVAGVRQEVDTVQVDLQQLHDEFSLVLAEVNSGVEETRADVLAMWRQLDEILELVQEVCAAPVVASHGRGRDLLHSDCWRV